MLEISQKVPATPTSQYSSVKLDSDAEKEIPSSKVPEKKTPTKSESKTGVKPKRSVLRPLFSSRSLE